MVCPDWVLQASERSNFVGSSDLPVSNIGLVGYALSLSLSNFISRWLVASLLMRWTLIITPPPPTIDTHTVFSEELLFCGNHFHFFCGTRNVKLGTTDLHFQEKKALYLELWSCSAWLHPLLNIYTHLRNMWILIFGRIYPTLPNSRFSQPYMSVRSTFYI